MEPTQHANQPALGHELLARVCLRAGKSELPGWAFYQDEPAHVVRVGADPTCEWQVVAAGVAAEVVRFACKHGILYFRANPGVGLRVNGAHAWDGVWLPANDGMRLDAGATSFDVAVTSGQ